MRSGAVRIVNLLAFHDMKLQSRGKTVGVSVIFLVSVSRQSLKSSFTPFEDETSRPPAAGG
jgi:hypothetical protein